MGKYRKGSHTKYDIKIHLVWVTKYRKPVMTKEVSKRARMLIREICLANEVQIKRTYIKRSHSLTFELSPKAEYKQVGPVFKRKDIKEVITRI